MELIYLKHSVSRLLVFSVLNAQSSQSSNHSDYNFVSVVLVVEGSLYTCLDLCGVVSPKVESDIASAHLKTAESCLKTVGQGELSS